MYFISAAVILLLQGVAMRNTIAYPTQQSSSPSRGIPCSHKRGNDDRVTAVYNCFTRNGGNAIPKHASPEVKVAILPLDLPCSGPVTHSEEILTTGKSHGKKPDRFSLNDIMDVEKIFVVECNLSVTTKPTLIS